MRTKEEISKEIEELREQYSSVQGTRTEVYQRIVGYMRNVNNWNAGKKDEYSQRKTFVVPTSCE